MRFVSGSRVASAIFANGGLGVDRFLSPVFPFLAIGIGLGLGLDDDAVLDWI